MNILLTRPAALNVTLATQLQAHGFNTINFPAIEIAPPTDLAALDTIIQQLKKQSDTDHASTQPYVIFTSPSCVSNLFALYPQLTLSKTSLFTIGRGTAQALKSYTDKLVTYPTIANSDSLLALLAREKLADKSLFIFTGEAGNTTLQEGLMAQGAKVIVGFTHRRSLPDYLTINWLPSEIDVMICTSLQALQYLRTIIDQHRLFDLLGKPLVVITEQMASVARQIDFKSAIIQASGASDEKLLTTLCDYQRRMQHD